MWFGLYPTVMSLSLLLSPMHWPLWLSLLIGNLLSSFTMTVVTMPFYVNRLLKRWLHPDPDELNVWMYWRGLAIVIGGLSLSLARYQHRKGPRQPGRVQWRSR